MESWIVAFVALLAVSLAWLFRRRGGSAVTPEHDARRDDPAPANPNYLQPVLRTPPTSVRLGLRLSF